MLHIPATARPSPRQHPAYAQRRRVVAGILLLLMAAASAAFAALVVLGDFHVTRVASGSMVPMAHVGDLEIVQLRPTFTMQRGQIVLLPSPDANVLYGHRVVAVTHSKGQVVVRTKGDANPVADDWTLTVTSPTVPVVVAVVPFAAVPWAPVNQTFTIVLWTVLFLLVGSFLVPRSTRSRRLRKPHPLSPWSGLTPKV